jgi:hypothetical protein
MYEHDPARSKNFSAQKTQIGKFLGKFFSENCLSGDLSVGKKNLDNETGFRHKQISFTGMLKARAGKPRRVFHCADAGTPKTLVEALNTPVVTPVVAPVVGLFGGRRDSFFVNPFKQVTKAPCKFHLLQGARSYPVVCSAPLFLPVVYRVTWDAHAAGLRGVMLARIV